MTPRRQRLATVIFAPDRGSAEDHDATELRKLEELVSKRESFVQLQHARSLSQDSARRNWLPVLAENNGPLQVKVEGIELLREDFRDISSSDVSPGACSWVLRLPRLAGIRNEMPKISVFEYALR